MKNKIFPILLLLVSLIQADTNKRLENLTLQEALEIVKQDNLEMDIATFDKEVADLGVKIAKGYTYGKLDAQIMGLRSNDPGNVFGFKLQSREATFRDFGFSDFLGGVGQAMGMAGGDFSTFSSLLSDPAMADGLLSTMPDDLNYPDARNHFDVKLTYMLPIYTGGKLTNYRNIAQQMTQMSTLDKEKVQAQKTYEVTKTFYDISLLYQFETDLTTIKNNIMILKAATIEFKKEGYAKKTDLLEVESKLSDVDRMLYQAQAHKELSYHFLSFLLDQDVSSIRQIPLDALESHITLENVLNHNKDIQKANLGLDIQSKMIDVAKANYKPEIGAFAEYGSSDNVFLDEFADHDHYTVGFQAKLNILNGGIDGATVEQEKIKRLKVKTQVALAKKGITLQYRKINTEINNLNKQIESTRKDKELADEIYEAYQERYREGLASINDVVIKQSLQLEKLLKLLELQNSRNEKVLQLEKMAFRGE